MKTPKSNLPRKVGHQAETRSTPSYRRLKSKLTALGDHWESVLFLDIETTGLSRYYHYVTVVGYSLAGQYGYWVYGDDESQLREALSKARFLVTFNGTLFDIPFLNKHFEDLKFPPEHIDLRYACRHLSLKGGQKKIEKLLGLAREDEIDGAMAVLLWHHFVEGDQKSLVRLLSYNREDIFGMAGIIDHLISEIRDAEELFPQVFFRNIQIEPEIRSFQSARSASERGLKPIRYWDIFSTGPSSEATIVGIDLTGSEKRPTGLAVSKGLQVDTALASSDEDILSYVRDAQPDLVSIDSPLSIPQGRISVFDDDPGRVEFGIMRICERTLKRRGINVYPSLLLSMQRLTKRGMELASRLRAEGFPVIESYPGAAQDIVGIARKGAGVEYLVAGLRRFGYQGGFETGDVNHDELDAITCTLVGKFFLSGKYEALGTEDEAPLIIPDLNAMSHRVVIGLSGGISAGKTTFARYLEGKGFAYSRYSQVIDEIIAERGLTPNRANRQKVGKELNEQGGQRSLGKRVVSTLPDDRPWVIDGLRFKEDHAFWREIAGAGFVHVHIGASFETRRSRYADGALAPAEFSAIDSAAVESEIAALAELADMLVENDGPMDRLRVAALSLAEHVLPID